MASTKIGAMRIDIGADTAQFDKAVSDTQRKLAGIGKRFEAAGARMVDFGKNLSIGLTAPLLAIGAASFKGAQEQAAAMGQVEAALKSMGPVAGRTAEQLSKAADSLEMRSLFDAEEILQKSTANLLTFGNVAKEQFDRAQQAAVDLATRMGGDLQAATILVGKALNDPIKGLSSLSRVGIQFTDQQKAQIEAMTAAGNAAGAQRIILAELEKQYGGAAQAAADTSPWRKAQVAMGQAADTIGEALLPIIPPLADAVASVARAFGELSPGMQKAVIIGGGFAAVFGPALIAVGGMVKGLGGLLPLLTKVGPAMTLIESGFAKAIPLIVNATRAMAAMALTPVGAVITGIAVAVGAVYLAWKNWDKIKAIIDKTVGWIKGLADGTKRWLIDAFGAHVKWVVAKVQQVGDAFFKLYDRVVGHSYIPDMVDGIGQHMARLQTNMVAVAQSATAQTAAAFAKLEEDVRPIMERLFPEKARAAQFEADRATIAGSKSLSEGEKTEALVRLDEEYKESFTPLVESVVQGLIMPISNAAGQVATGAVDAWEQVRVTTESIRLNFEDAAMTVAGAIQSVVGLFRSDAPWWEKLLGAIQIGVQAYAKFSGAAPGFASGGSLQIGGVGGIDKNILSLNNQPIARVSRGEYLDVTPATGMRQGSRGSAPIVFDMRGAVVTEDLLQQMNAIAAGSAVTVVGASNRRMAQRARQGLGR